MAVAAAALLHSSCAVPDARPAPDVRFIVTGNTSPASPFTGHAEKLDYAFRAINQENPMLVIHTGNIIQGGRGSMGITRNDVVRQFRKFIEQKSILAPVIHILAGDRDLYNGSANLFIQFTGQKLFYSFNFGEAHFIMLHLTGPGHRAGPEQMSWLRRDLERYRRHGAIFVFTHYPVLAAPATGIRHPDGEELHALFAGYPVRAVISGNVKNLYEYERDGIRYIAAGCFGFNYEDWHWSFNQYYWVRYDGTRVTVKGCRVNYPPNTYRPRLFKDEPEKK